MIVMTISEVAPDPAPVPVEEIVSIGALKRATARGLNTLFGTALAGAIAAAYGEEAQPHSTLTLTDAALLLSVALLPVAREGPSLPRLALVAVDLAWQGREVTLTPAQALAHPALRDWLAPTWDEQVGLSLRAGAQLSFAAPGAPELDYLEAADQGGAIARTVLAWENYQATAVFGRLWDSEQLTCSVRLPGPLLRAIGADLLRVPMPAPQPATTAEELLPAVPTVH
jgi:hypothetical protein